MWQLLKWSLEAASEIKSVPIVDFTPVINMFTDLNDTNQSNLCIIKGAAVIGGRSGVMWSRILTRCETASGNVWVTSIFT